MRAPSLLLPLTLGLAHGAADGAAGFLLGRLAEGYPLTQVALYVLLYNGLAFGAQPVAGLLVDRWRQPRFAAVVGLVLVVASLLCARWPWLAVVLAGLGGAAFHTAGGALALAATPASVRGPGLFAAPGVLGLALGGALAALDLPATAGIVALLAVLAAAMLWQPAPTLADDPPDAEPVLEGHDVLMMALLAAIALRSAVWATFDLVLAGNLPALLAVAGAAALGKGAGGYLADWLGERRWAIGALLAAAPLLAFGPQRLEVLLLGVALLQSATPVALRLAARLLPRQPATASGLVFGLAVVVGGLPVLAGLGPLIAAPAGVLLMTAAAGGLFWLGSRRRARLAA